MVHTERSPADVRFDKWMARGKGFVLFSVGMLTGVTSMLIFGDSRYVRVDQFASHSSIQQKVDEHNALDMARFATKEDLAAHTAQVGHAPTVEINRKQEGRLRRLEANQAWIATALFAIARRNGVQLPPPPELQDPKQPDE